MNDHALLFPELQGLAEPPQPEELSRLRTGVFPSQKIEEFIASGWIRATSPIADVQIQPASFDLRLGPVAYRVRASFLPGKSSTVEARI